jgi:hypothetical protein
MLVAGFGAAQTANQVLIGSFVANSGIVGIVGIGNASSTGILQLDGASHILGIALQSGIVASDEVLVLVGRVL